ncbi:hypothetical protein E2C01_000311 [Portunus trituberculatus]|uniref:Uncharacterized protein n=1 Tax=Portunus trituberculatus TaxID=210409 RepID=A0A5B7CGA6_PORTR|nr:hypothetical protein [Portunus trituberculatus]
MLVAPRALATLRHSRPMGPAPVTSTLQPAHTTARRQACTATASGSTTAPSSSLTESGNLRFDMRDVLATLGDHSRRLVPHAAGQANLEIPVRAFVHRAQIRPAQAHLSDAYQHLWEDIILIGSQLLLLLFFHARK